MVVVIQDPASVLARDQSFRDMNYQLQYEDCDTTSTGASGTGSKPVAGGTGCGELGYRSGVRDSQKNKEQIWSYLKAKGLSDEAAAGIMGNMAKESAYMPDAQNGTGQQEISNVNGHFDPGSSDGRGCIGLVQWCYGRAEGLVKKSAAEGKDWRCLDVQLDYMWYEMTETSESAVMDPLKAATSPGQAANIFHDIYERSNTATGENLGRDTLAEDAYTEFTGKNPGPTPTSSGSSSSTTDVCAPVPGQSGSNPVTEMDGFNYAFPVQLGKNDVSNGYSWPCPGSCHHDGTNAFDLSRPAQDDSSEGVPVIAITDGTIAMFSNEYNGVVGCQSFQLVGKDGYSYWNGHIQSSSVQNGSEVTAGQQISVIGRRDCTGNGSYPHLHIDRGAKGTSGGSVGNRDAGFTDVMNKLWEELSGAA